MPTFRVGLNEDRLKGQFFALTYTNARIRGIFTGKANPMCSTRPDVICPFPFSFTLEKLEQVKCWFCLRIGLTTRSLVQILW